MKKISTFFLSCLLTSFAAQAQGDIAMFDVGPLDYQVPGTRSFNVTIKQAGSAGISSYEIYWKLNNGPVNSVSKVAYDTKWNASYGLVHDASFKATFPSAGNYQLKVWVKSIKPVDNNHANDTITKNVRVYESLPKKNVVLEIFKHQTCGPCYDAANYVDTLVSKNHDYAVASIYTVTSDKLYNAEGATVNANYGFAHPAPVFDRFKFPFRSGINNSFASGIQTGYTLGGYGEREQYFEPVQVFFNTVNWNATTRELKVKIGAKFYDDLSGDYRFNLYLTEDGIMGYQASAPDPNKFIHNHVTRAMLGGSWGLQGSLPATIKANDMKFHEFTYTIPADYDIKKIHLIAMVQTYTGDDTKRTILNSQQKSFEQALSLQDVTNTPQQLSVYPNPAKDYLTIALDNNNGKGYDLRIIDISGKVYMQQHSSGSTQVNLQSLPAGNYILQADDGQVVHTQTIVKE